MTAPRCIDCEHFGRALFPSGHPRVLNCWCARPIGTKTDPVNGTTTQRIFVSPFDERKSGRTMLGFGRGRCGPQGKFFELARPPEPPHGGGGGSK